MRVLYFHQHFSTPDGAAATRSYEMAIRLKDAGHHVTIVCGSSARAKTGLVGSYSRGRREGKVDGVTVVELRVAYSNHQGLLHRTVAFMLYAIQASWIALFRNYDVIFATSTPLTAGIPGMVGRWFRGRPFVFEVRDLWPDLPRQMGVVTNPIVLKAMEVLEWVTYRSACRIIGLAPGMVRGIRKRGVPSDRVIMIPNGCDLELFGPRPSYDRGSRVDELVHAEFVAAYAGAHGIANGLDAVLDAARELNVRGRRDIAILFVGDGKLKADLVRRARQERLDNCVFLDLMPKPMLARLLGQVNVGLMILENVPAFYDGTSPNKFFDYIAAGLPVITNYPGWVADMIEDAGCGVVVPPSDASAFADALERLADQPDECQRMGSNARMLAEERFARDRLGRAFRQVLESAAADDLSR